MNMEIKRKENGRKKNTKLKKSTEARFNRDKLKKLKKSASSNKEDIEKLKKQVESKQNKKFKKQIKQKKDKIVEMTSNISRRKRLKICILVIIFIFSIFVVRIGWIQFVDGEWLSEMALEQQSLDRAVNPRRGTIYDATGKTVLAVSSTVNTITVNPNNIAKEDKEKVAEALSNIFELEYETVLKNYYENKYILEEKMDTKNSNTLRSVLINFFSEYSFLILVFVIMIAGGMVSDEFSRGTIKSLLTVPYKRSSILTAKYITVLLIIPFIVIFLLIWEFLVGGILLGFDSLSIPVAIYNITSGSLEVLNVFSYFIINFLANLPQLILLATLAFAASVILNSTAFAIAITFCGIIASEIINSFALMYNIKILNYFVTTNWDFTAFLFGCHSVFGLSLTHSIIICIIYLIIMLVVTFLVFMKKDIKNV